MDFISPGKNGGSRTLHRRGASGSGSTRMAHVIGSLVCLMVLVSGCATPKLQTSDPELLLQTGLLSFLEQGLTTREAVALKLGLPTMQMEGERILMYQLRADSEGNWFMTAPQLDARTGLRTWREGTSSLVLVFGDDGVLRKFSLVTTR